MNKLMIVLCMLLMISCDRNSRKAVDRWANDMREIDRTEDVNNRMASYDWYYDQYHAIEAYRIQYETDSDEISRTAVRNILNREISKYNSNASKYYKEMWMGQGLPKHIDLIKE